MNDMRSRPKNIDLLLSLLLLGPGLLLGACKTNPITVARQDARHAEAEQVRSALTSSSVSTLTRRTVSTHGIGTEHDLTDLPSILAAFHGADMSDHAVALAKCELLYLALGRLSDEDAERSALEIVVTAERSLRGDWGAARGFDDRYRLLTRLYNAALAHWVSRATESLRTPIVHSLTEQFDFRVEGEWPTGYFDRFTSSKELAVRGITNRHTRSGLGATLVGFRANEFSESSHLPPEGIFRSVTAILTIDKDDNLVLSMYDPMDRELVEFGDGVAQLAADFTAPYASLAATTHLASAADAGFLDPEDVRARRGIYLLQEYDPDRIPIVLIHGLWSSPLTWREVTNEIWGDPLLRERFQIWHYVYPTGTPVLTTARDLRLSLEGLIHQLDPERDDEATNDIVLIGHSMGGLIAKTLVQSSGSAVWDARFRISIEEMSLAEGDRAVATQIYFFEPLPFIERVIFLATPHRGSELADGFMGRLGDSLVRPSAVLKGLSRRISSLNPGARYPDSRDAPSSIDVLSPSHAVLRSLSELAIDSQVSYHSIIATKDGSSGEHASDGVVLYESAHLQGAASELIVEAGHDVVLHEDSWREIRRILHGKIKGPAGD